MSTESETGLALQVSDVSMQKMANVRDVPPDGSVGELVDALLRSLNLPTNDASGRPLAYHARLEREGRHLLPSERIGDAIQTGDLLVLHPNVDAGGGAAACGGRM